MKNERFFLAILLIVSVGTLLAEAAGNCQSGETAADGLNCSPAPCVLPPTQASEGGGTVTDTPVVANPLNRDDLLLGSVDYNCGQESNVGFHLSSDGGSTWKRVECMAAITTKQNNYLALDEPSVSYDRTGTAYIAEFTRTSRNSEVKVSSPSKNQPMEATGASPWWRYVAQARLFRI